MGSMERMIAILCEHYAGKWPLWISPRQIMIVPISEVSMGEQRPSSFLLSDILLGKPHVERLV